MLRGHLCYLVCYLCCDLQHSQESVPEPNPCSKHSAGHFTLSPCHKEIRNCSN